jgi:NCS1 family nucleobase:cation symporter-1
MITAIWPSFKNLPNTLPEGANVTSSEFLCFFLFWLYVPLLSSLQ